jgi:WD40 repeat protein
LEGHANAVLGVSFSRDGQRLLSCGWDRVVRVWDVQLGMEFLTLHGPGQPVFAAHFSPDGRRVACLSAPFPSGGVSRYGRAWLWESVPE